MSVFFGLLVACCFPALVVPAEVVVPAGGLLTEAGFSSPQHAFQASIRLYGQSQTSLSEPSTTEPTLSGQNITRVADTLKWPEHAFASMYSTLVWAVVMLGLASLVTILYAWQFHDRNGPEDLLVQECVDLENGITDAKLFIVDNKLPEKLSNLIWSITDSNRQNHGGKKNYSVSSTNSLKALHILREREKGPSVCLNKTTLSRASNIALDDFAKFYALTLYSRQKLQALPRFITSSTMTYFLPLSLSPARATILPLSSSIFALLSRQQPRLPSRAMQTLETSPKLLNIITQPRLEHPLISRTSNDGLSATTHQAIHFTLQSGSRPDGDGNKGSGLVSASSSVSLSAVEIAKFAFLILGTGNPVWVARLLVITISWVLATAFVGGPRRRQVLAA